jgi:putative NADH-flavin reductase
MKIAVIAASGRSGRVFVEEAVAAGHTVRAGVRNLKRLKDDSRVTYVQCDATSKHDVRNLLKQQEAVVSFIGHVKGSPATLQTKATEVALDVMHEHGISRIISLTGTGVRLDGDHISIMDRLMNASIAVIDPKRIRDGIMHFELLKDSDLDWTVVRVLKLQNISAHSFILREHGPTKIVVGRREVVKACIQLLEENSFIHQAPMICVR